MKRGASWSSTKVTGTYYAHGIYNSRNGVPAAGPEFYSLLLMVSITEGCCGRSQQRQWLWWEVPGPSNVGRWWTSGALHHHVWALDGLGTVDDIRLRHTLIKTSETFQLTHVPAAVLMGECYPVCAVVTATSVTLCRGCRSKVSAWRVLEGQGEARKVVNILLGRK